MPDQNLSVSKLTGGDCPAGAACRDERLARQLAEQLSGLALAVGGSVRTPGAAAARRRGGRILLRRRLAASVFSLALLALTAVLASGFTGRHATPAVVASPTRDAATDSALRVTITADGAQQSIKPGDGVVVFTVTVTNSGPSAAAGLAPYLELGSCPCGGQDSTVPPPAASLQLWDAAGVAWRDEPVYSFGALPAHPVPQGAAVDLAPGASASYIFRLSLLATDRISGVVRFEVQVRFGTAAAAPPQGADPAARLALSAGAS